MCIHSHIIEYYFSIIYLINISFLSFKISFHPIFIFSLLNKEKKTLFVVVRMSSNSREEEAQKVKYYI